MLEPAMQNDWRSRLRKALDRDERSDRRISLDAGLGPNFISQLYNDGKEPGIDKLMAVLNELGTAAALTVIADYEISDQDEALLRAVLDLEDEAKENARAFFESLQAPARRRVPRASGSPAASATGQTGSERRSR